MKAIKIKTHGIKFIARSIIVGIFLNACKYVFSNTCSTIEAILLVLIWCEEQLLNYIIIEPKYHLLGTSIKFNLTSYVTVSNKGRVVEFNLLRITQRRFYGNCFKLLKKLIQRNRYSFNTNFKV